MKFSDIGTGVCLHSIIRLEIIVQAYMIYNLCLQTHNKFCTSSSLGNKFQLTQQLYMQHCLRLEKSSWEGQTTVSGTHDTLYITRNI